MDYSNFETEFNGILDNINLYKVLGVDKRATKKEIKKAYHKKALLLHPDKYNNNSQEEMHILNAVYEILKDPIKRRNYDGECSADYNELSNHYKIIQELEKDYKEKRITKKEYNKLWREAMPKEYDAINEPDYTLVNTEDTYFSNKFNKIFKENRKADPSDIGYGEYGKELASRTNKKVGASYNKAVELSNIKKPNRVFKKFDTNEFNYVFDQIKKEKDNEEFSFIEDEEVQGINASDNSLASPISNFNGLLIVGNDKFTSQLQLNETSGNSLQYTDYHDAFNFHENPETIEISEKEYKRYIKRKKKETSSLNKKETLDKIDSYKNVSNLNPMETKEEYFKKKRKDMEAESKRSRKFVERFISQYPEHLIQSALQGKLECSNEKSDTSLFYGN